MLPILIVPLRPLDSDGMPPFESSASGHHGGATARVRRRPRTIRRNLRIRLGRVIEIRHTVPRIPCGNDYTPGTLQDCDQALKMLLRRKAKSLGRRERSDIRHALSSGNAVSLSVSTLSPAAATWLLWAMSWRGVSTTRQFASPALHAPTLVTHWWASMPESLCWGPARTLLRVLCDCAARLYRFWGRLVQRLRAAGLYSINPRSMKIRFTPLLCDSNSADGKAGSVPGEAVANRAGKNSPTTDNIAVSVDEESTACNASNGRFESGGHQSDSFASAE
jgi:hypothetical protein